ncbi:Coilin [Rhynchospora pubera]|uniref:Coilin n=1 Tax=Rhynchospora pubera TaxID=906938 RepID=A0AAV8HN86_9POAL|nr:Coilin [Rhynchospora pubera]
MRIRLVFDEGNLLTKEQRVSGLRRCWFLIKPEIATVGDLASDLSFRFQLQRNCPDGISFSMDDFVIPPFESISFFREKDIVRVHKRTCKKKMITRVDDVQLIDRGEIVENKAAPCSKGMLAIESRDGVELRNNQVVREGSPQTPLAVTASKRKRKEMEKPESSKKKKKKSCILNGNSYQTQEEPNQLSFQRASTPEQILHGKENTSDANGSSESNIQLEENCNANACEPNSSGPTKKFPSRSARRKHTKRLLKKEMRKQAAENMHSAVLSNGTAELATTNHVAPVQEPTVNHDLVVARVDRPGHIRFESEGEEDDVDEDDTGPSNVQPCKTPMENFQWNGITNKAKGQKWGQGFKSRNNANGYKSSSSNWRNTNIEDNFTNEMAIEKSTSDIGKASVQLNFETLSPLTRCPKEGDLIVYRVVELSSTWCPDLSPFRVGEVKVYDPMSNKIILMPVPSYPIHSDRKEDSANNGEEDASSQNDLSLYKEDGSLEIELTSLVDVRVLRDNGSVSPSTTSVGRKMNSSQTAIERYKSQVGNERHSNWEVNVEVANSGNTQAQKNGWDMMAGKGGADSLVNPTEGCIHVEKTPSSNNNWDVALQNEPEEPLPNLNGTEPNYNGEINVELENAGNTNEEQNGWDNWTPNTSTPSWSYRALRGSALGPTMALLRGSYGNAMSGDSNAVSGRGRGKGRGRGRRGRGKHGYSS